MNSIEKPWKRESVFNQYIYWDGKTFRIFKPNPVAVTSDKLTLIVSGSKLSARWQWIRFRIQADHGWFMDDLWVIYGWLMDDLWMIYDFVAR